MRTRIKSLINIYDDADELIPLFAPPEDRLLEVVADGWAEFSAGKFRIAAGAAAFTVPLGTVGTPRAIFLRIEGAPGANVAVNGGTARQIRPITDAASSAESTPVAFLLETSSDVASMTIANPEAPGGETIAGFYVVVGDAA